MTIYSAAELFDACKVLFGSQIGVSIEFLRYLRPAGIKDAYWRRARETHPDRASILGVNEKVLTEQFKAVSVAYERLMAAVKGDGTILIQQDPSGTNLSGHPACTPKATQGFNNRFYQGSLPRWKLLIGQYLYYSGLISWGALIDAIASQRRQRPLIGRIALDWGLLTDHDIGKILMHRQFNEKFGDCALRHGFLTDFHLKTLLFRQQLLQRPIGNYFRKYGFSESVMDRLVAEQQIHNRRFS